MASSNPSQDTLTHQLILAKAYRVFATVGFHSISLSQLAKTCNIAEETLHQQFDTKSDLYQSAFQQAMRSQQLMQPKPAHHGNDQWLSELIDFYLSDEHILSELPGCPLAFLASDTQINDPTVRQTYASAFISASRWISQFFDPPGARSNVTAQTILTSMIGAVGVARSMQNAESRHEFLTQCRNDIYRRLQLPPLLT